MRSGTYSLRYGAGQMPSCGNRTDHPVARLLRERAEAGFGAGGAQDPRHVALVLEGGGRRGVVSAGMVAALERLA